MINTARLTQTFLDLVRIDSPSLQEKAVADHLSRLCLDAGYDVRIDDTANKIGGNTGNLVVRVPATGPGAPIAFCAHMDCVPPCVGVVPIVENGLIRSVSDTVLGGDDKAGISAILEAITHLHEEGIPHPELWLIFTVCEEAGMFGSKNLDLSVIPAQEFVVLDAGGDVGTIIVRSPSKADMTMTFHGRAAHAGIEPEKGISAIQMAAYAIERMQLLRIDEETVANLGRIEGGGQTNIVTNSVTVTGEVRAQTKDRLQSQIEHMRSCCEDAARHFGGTFDFDHHISYPAMSIAPDSALLHRATHACAKLGFPSATKGTGGGSDANIFSGQGRSCINLCIGMSKVHTTEEFIRIEDMVNTTKFTAELMQSF